LEKAVKQGQQGNGKGGIADHINRVRLKVIDEHIRHVNEKEPPNWQKES